MTKIPVRCMYACARAVLAYQEQNTKICSSRRITFGGGGGGGGRHHANLRYVENRSISFSHRFARVALTHFTGTLKMKSTKVQTLGRIWRKYWNIWIENTFS